MKKYILVPLLTITLVALTAVNPASAGWADSKNEGSTLAPGGSSALNIVQAFTAWNDGTKVNKSDSIYNSGVSGLVSVQNVCNPKSTWKYTPKDGSTHTKTLSATTCGLWRSYIRWDAPGKMEPGADFCAKQSNNKTGDENVNYACVKLG